MRIVYSPLTTLRSCIAIKQNHYISFVGNCQHIPWTFDRIKQVESAVPLITWLTLNPVRLFINASTIIIGGTLQTDQADFKIE